MDDTEEKLLTSSMSPVSWDACGDGLRGLYNQSEAVTLKEKLHFCLIKFCFHCSCCLHTPSFSPHSWQLVSFKLQISCPWTQVEPQTLMLKSCSSLTRRRSLTPKCTKKHWTLSSMRHLFSRWVLFLHAAVKKKRNINLIWASCFFFLNITNHYRSFLCMKLTVCQVCLALCVYPLAYAAYMLLLDAPS